MSRPRAESLAFYAADSEVEPDAQGWVKTGSQTPNFLSDGLELNDVSAVDALTYHRVLQPSDSVVTGPARYGDDIAVQSYVRGITSAPSWGSGASPIALFIDDGLRQCALSIGSTLRLIHPTTGAVLATIATGHPWLIGLHYELRKVGSARWDVFVRGLRVFTLPYDVAPASAGFPARAGFGILNPTGQGRAVFDLVETGLNQALPEQWVVDRWYAAMPPTVTKNWTTVARAALRAIVGLAEEGDRTVEEAYRALTAEKLDLQSFSAPCIDRTPDDEKAPWTELGGAQVTGLVRERVRLDTDGTLTVGYQADITATSGPLTRETTAKATFMVREYTPDAGGRVGPQIRVRDGARVIYATMFEDPAGGGDTKVVWALTSGFTLAADPVTVVGNYRWRVDPYQEHEVEVQVLGQHQILLLVNRQIVDRIPYTDAAVDVSAPSVRIGQQGAAPASASCSFYVADLLAARRFTDLKRRPVFEQNLLERLVFVSGCDRNDELDTWARHHWEMEALRGTVIGAETEMRRLACCEDVRMVSEQVSASWVLEESFPETTPIYLELDGFITSAFLEFCREAPNFTDQELADLAARYLVPLSVEEMRYFIAVATLQNGALTPVGPSQTRIPVLETDPFEVGDVITIRNAANTVREDATVNAIDTTPVSLVVTALANSYAVGSIVRKTLAST